MKLLFKLPPFSVVPFALHRWRKLPGLLWVGVLGFLAWNRFGPEITKRVRAATADYPPPAAGPWSGSTGSASGDTPTMAVAADLAPANAAPLVDDEVAPDPAPVTTTG